MVALMFARERLRAPLATVVMVTALASCKRDPTQLVVTVDTNYAIPSALGAVSVRIRDAAGIITSSREVSLVPTAGDARPSAVSIPFSFAVAPLEADARRRVSIEIDGQAGPGGPPIVRRRVATGFLEHRALRLDIFLERACEAIWTSCGAGETCVDGSSCVPERVEPEELPEVQPGTEIPPGIVSPPAPSPQEPCLTSRCLDDRTLRDCRDDGMAMDIPCALGCSSTGGAHCGVLFPSGGAVDAADLVPRGDLSALLLSSTTLDSDTGSIMNVRPEGPGIINGIGFEVRNGVGVFTFSSLTIQAGATLSLRGENAVALAAAGDITVSGVIDARGDCLGTNAGPGGAPGGRLAAAGEGLGGGSGGAGAHDDASGGGGGGHGSTGGAGGAGTIAPRTTGGAAYGDDRIDLLVGGSGGGGGGGPSAGPGGGGGGAVQLIAGAASTITGGGGINAGGCGGKGASSGAGDGDDGGGGGGSGGTILMEAASIRIGSNGALAVSGGGGGGADSGGADGEPGALRAAPSAGGQGSGGDGGAGGAQGSLPGRPGEDDKNGGGGGGGVGRIRLNTLSGSALVEAGSILSPELQDPTTTATQGFIDVR